MKELLKGCGRAGIIIVNWTGAALLVVILGLGFFYVLFTLGRLAWKAVCWLHGLAWS